MLLQPKPNKIRPKGETKVLRRLLLECRHLQRQRRHTLRSVENGASDKKGIVNVERAPLTTPTTTSHIYTDSSYISSSHDFSLESFGHEQDLNTAGPSITELLEVPVSSPTRAESDGYCPVTSNIREPQIHMCSPPDSNPSIPSPDWAFQEYISPLEYPDTEPLTLARVNKASIYDSLQAPNIHDDLEFDSFSYPDIGFDLDFGPRNDYPCPESFLNRSAISSADVWQTEHQAGPSYSNPLVPRRHPMVNSTYMQDNCDPYWVADLDSPNLKEFEVSLLQLDSPNPQSDSLIRQVGCSHTQKAPSNENLISGSGQPGPSQHSPSDSSISTLLSKMSLSLSSTSHDSQHSPTPGSHSSVPELHSDSLMALPGSFPEYCWQHLIQKSQLRRCDRFNGLQNCSSLSHLKDVHVCRCLDPDIFSRIVRRDIQKEDLHETDVFGNTIIHISATLFATPSYLISLIKLGAKINVLNEAGQTFLHLLKPEVLNYCDDFCYLLELLRVQGFNFRQHDHLGQSPLHLLTRPWIDHGILREIITKLGCLPISRHISTARDWLGYTVIEQLNMHATGTGLELDQAILSLSCETENAICDSKGLGVLGKQSDLQTHTVIDQKLARNYENHPQIDSIEDLFLYEQHVDYWRTIIAAKDSPWFHDSAGRNGLHCLAEVSLVTPEMSLPAALLCKLDSLKDMGDSNMNSDRECFVKCLLNVGVDPNNYDNNGNTPFMAFIVHHRADEDDNATTRILKYLIASGSDIHRRNRQGETALHLAVKLGRRAATKLLLASGANIHARTSRCLGILELGQVYATEGKQNEQAFAQIMLCMSLAASFGAVSKPTILDEWGSPGWKTAPKESSQSNGFKLVKKFITNQLKGKHRKEASSGLYKS